VLERRGLIERDIENAWLAAGAEPGPLDDLMSLPSVFINISTIDRK
jgi:hypothetical protein